MRYLLLFASLPLFAQFGDGLYLVPSTITDCQSGLGRTTVTWSPRFIPQSQVRVNSSQGTPLTGLQPSGAISTGYSITDGTVFYLTDADGKVLATAVARLNCQELAPAVRESFANNTYLPLQLGNRWVYRYTSPFSIGEYRTREVVALEEINGITWYVIRTREAHLATISLARYRVDEDGRVLRLDTNGEVIVRDPNAAKAESEVVTNVGTFADGRTTDARTGILSTERQTWVRGVGLVSQVNNTIGGSGGTWSNRMELVEATVGGVHQPGPAASISAGLERTKLAVSTRGVSNFPAPCFSVACFIPAADPPGTYKPCTFARLETRNFPSGNLVIMLRNESGQPVYEASFPSPPDGVTYTRIPLYSSPNEPFPPGRYQLAAILASGDTEVASTRIGIEIE